MSQKSLSVLVLVASAMLTACGGGGGGGDRTSSGGAPAIPPALSIHLSYPTPNANLGGDAVETWITGYVTDASGTVNASDISSLTVNGVFATFDRSEPHRWRAKIPVSPGANQLSLSLVDSVGVVKEAVYDLDNSAPARVEGSVFDAYPLGIAIDETTNRLWVVGSSRNGFVEEFNLTDGARRVVSSETVGSGHRNIDGRFLVHDSSNDRLFVANAGNVIAISLSDLNRTFIYDSTISDRITGVDFNPANNSLLVSGSSTRAVVAIDVSSGIRSVVSSPTVGSGISLDTPSDIAFDNSRNRALVADSNGGAIISVDLSTGHRERVHYFLAGGILGSLGITQSPGLIDLDNFARQALLEVSDGLVLFNLSNGNISVLDGSGPEIQNFSDLAYDTLNSRAFVVDGFMNALVVIDLLSGDRAIAAQ